MSVADRSISSLCRNVSASYTVALGAERLPVIDLSFPACSKTPTKIVGADNNFKSESGDLLIHHVAPSERQSPAPAEFSEADS